MNNAITKHTLSFSIANCATGDNPDGSPEKNNDITKRDMYLESDAGAACSARTNPHKSSVNKNNMPVIGNDYRREEMWYDGTACATPGSEFPVFLRCGGPEVPYEIFNYFLYAVENCFPGKSGGTLNFFIPARGDNPEIHRTNVYCCKSFQNLVSQSSSSLVDSDPTRKFW